MDRLLVVLACVSACSGHDRAPPSPAAPAPTTPAIDAAHGKADTATPSRSLTAPGVRLPEGATPLAYDLRLELDPDSDTFTGTVAIHVRLDRASDHVWLHADELAVSAAHWDDGPLELLHVPGADRMIALGFGGQVAPREVTLTLVFTGSMQHDEEGLFRQKDNERWYLYSQGESEFARRITPCFDEPRWKTPWRVTVVVPKAQVAASNMPIASDTLRTDGRREVAFAETPPMASYLLALAVGPFAVIDAGKVGAHHVPLRVLTFPRRAKSVGAVARQTPKLVAELEAYTALPLPFPKLDIVTVPHLFGAMENPGLITFDADIVFESDRHYAIIAAHELAHQWFGNLVTPVWWDDLWLSEAFASWLGERVAAHNEGHPPSELHVAITRESALAADGEAGARALHRPITFDPDNAFDSIAYDKGEAVLTMFEHWIGEDVFRAGLRTYLKDHADHNVTTADLAHALASVATPEAAQALQAYIDFAGAPVVELALRCDPGAAPTLVAHARDHLSIPVCVRVGGIAKATKACALVGETTPIVLAPAPAACPAWVFANGGGYYHVVWTTNGPRGPLPKWSALSAGDKLALAADLAAATARGDLEPRAALAELAALATDKDIYAQYAAVAIAQAIDALVGEATREPWERWLVAHFTPRYAAQAFSRHGMLETRIRDALFAMVAAPRLPAATRERALAAVTKSLAKHTAPWDSTIVLAAGGDATVFAKLAMIARDPKLDLDQREAAMADLAAFGPDEVGAAVTELAALLPARSAWTAVSPYFERGATRGSAWTAVRDHLADLLARMSPGQVGDLLDTLGSLCDPKARAEVQAAFAPQLAKILDGKPRLEHALAAIDRCIARRTKAGEITAVLP